MWKLYLILAIFIGATSSVKSQECGVDSIPGTALPNFPTVLYPVTDSLPCTVIGQAVADTLYFTNFTTIQGFTVVSVTIDSINNLPYGVCWATNVTGNTFPAGQNGVIFLIGIPNDAPAQYKMAIHLSATTDIGQIPDFNLETVTGYRYYVRLAWPGCPCPPLDSVGGVDSAYIYYTSATCEAAGIKAVNQNFSDLSVVPNPFSQTATVSFSSNVSGTFSLQLIDMLGEAVSTQNVRVVSGNNEFRIKGNGLSQGVYILHISDGNSSATKKVVIE